MRVAIRGDDGAVADALDSAEVSLVGEADADVLVVVDDEALVSLAADAPACPVLPVTAGENYHSVSRAKVRDAVETVAADGHRLVDAALVTVAFDDETVGRAVADVTLMTSAPAKISEYAVHTGGERVGQIRADGIVVATPVGSAGYARNAGGPVVGVGAGLSVVPVAPFATLSNPWVLDPPLSLSVERDEGDVSLFLDGEYAADVTTGTPVTVERDGSIPFVRVPGATGRQFD
jgi:NAD+ kinase